MLFCCYRSSKVRGAAAPSRQASLGYYSLRGSSTRGVRILERKFANEILEGSCIQGWWWAYSVGVDRAGAVYVYTNINMCGCIYRVRAWCVHDVNRCSAARGVVRQTLRDDRFCPLLIVTLERSWRTLTLPPSAPGMPPPRWSPRAITTRITFRDALRARRAFIYLFTCTLFVYDNNSNNN